MIGAGDPRHGTKTGHVRGCRDDCCRRANALYQNLWRMGLTNKTVDGTGTRRRIQALQALGWSSTAIAEAGGFPSEAAVRQVIRATRGTTMVWTSTATRALQAYTQLSMRPGPSRLVRDRAARKGWPVPLAWDDDIDDPAAEPVVIVVPGRTLRRKVDPDDVEWLLDSGCTRAAIEARLHIQPHTLQRVLSRHRPDLWVRIRDTEQARTTLPRKVA